MRKNKHIPLFLLASVIIAMIGFGCTDDRADELTSIDYERLFSPIDIETFVINRTDARIEWTFNKGVESYTIELFANDSLTFEGTPVSTAEGVTTEQYPFYFRELDGETQYSVRIKSVAAGKADSKWSSATFKTDTENIFLSFQDGDITATSAILRWTPGKIVTTISIEPGDIIYSVSDEEIENGMAVIDGLIGETDYTATLYNESKVRGTTTFTTLLDIGSAIPVYPEDDFMALLAGARAGDAFAFFPGNYGTGTEIIINKDVEIKGVYPYDRPVFYGFFQIEEGAGLTIRDIILDGTGIEDDSQAFVFGTTETTYNTLNVSGSEIRNYVKGVMYLNVASVVKNITFTDNIFHHIECSGGDFIDSRKGAFETLDFTNNTVYNSVNARDFIRYDDASSTFPDISSAIFVDHNTLYGISDSSSKRLLYVRFKRNTITFTNTIVAQTNAIFSNQSNTDPETQFGGNNFFNAPNLFSESGSASTFFDDSATQEDPGFTDADNGDFTVTHELLKAKGIGDPRWTN